jgi:hypothetical protein
MHLRIVDSVFHRRRVLYVMKAFYMLLVELIKAFWER